MRTTVALPSGLLRQAKALAAQRGETLEALLTRALATEIGKAHQRTHARARVNLPLLGAHGTPLVRLEAADLERALADVDAFGAGR